MQSDTQFRTPRPCSKLKEGMGRIDGALSGSFRPCPAKFCQILKLRQLCGRLCACFGLAGASFCRKLSKLLKALSICVWTIQGNCRDFGLASTKPPVEFHPGGSRLVKTWHWPVWAIQGLPSLGQPYVARRFTSGRLRACQALAVSCLSAALGQLSRSN